MYPPTIHVETPDPPAWMADNPACLWAWQSDLNWRADAGGATDEGYQQVLRAQAEDRYAAFQARRGPGRPAKAAAHQRKHTGVYLSDAERAAVEAVLLPGEDFSGFMREAARLLILQRRMAQA